jgi:hypothetical protein
MAALMLPSAVLTYLKVGARAVVGPPPAMMAWWEQPALVTPPKQHRPSAGSTASIRLKKSYPVDNPSPSQVIGGGVDVQSGAKEPFSRVQLGA